MKPDHVLNTWQPYFMHIVEGKKTFEVRSTHGGSREFENGQILNLVETYPDTKTSTGKEYLVAVNYVLDLGVFGAKGYVAMSITPHK